MPINLILPMFVATLGHGNGCWTAWVLSGECLPGMPPSTRRPWDVHPGPGSDPRWHLGAWRWWMVMSCEDIRYYSSICAFVDTHWSHLNLEASVFISLGWSWWRESRGDAVKMPCRWYHRKRSHENPNRCRKWTMKSGAGFLYGRGFALKRSLFKRCGCFHPF